jgi:RNA polymerase sigma-70 factor, ECF subfamily
VDAVRAARGDGCASAIRTLGDLLYAEKAKTVVSERDWVELVSSVAARDQQALRALYDRTHRIVFTLIVRITNDRETAEELTLDVFHDVWRRAATYDPAGGTVLAWIMSQARSRAIDRLRFEQRKKRVDPHPNHPLPVAPAGEPHEALDARDLARLLRQALTMLTPQERQVLETAFFSDLTYAEVSVQLNQPIGTVKTRARSGLAKLRDALRKGREPG